MMRKKLIFLMKGGTMSDKNVVLDLEQIKAIERLVYWAATPGITNIDASDIQEFLKYGKKFIYKTATITEATKAAVEKSGLICDELHRAHKYIISIESGNNMTFEDIDKIASFFHNFEERPCFAFGTGIDEYKEHEFQVELFMVE